MVPSKSSSLSVIEPSLSKLIIVSNSEGIVTLIFASFKAFLTAVCIAYFNVRESLTFEGPFNTTGKTLFFSRKIFNFAVNCLLSKSKSDGIVSSHNKCLITEVA